MVIRRSPQLSWLLRHGANSAGLTMDSAGFAAIADVLSLTQMTRAELDDAVERNNKQRFEVKGDRIRAVQGHSLAGTPITMEGLEHSWQQHSGDAPLFHGTSFAAAARILAGEGIHSAARTHVHLAPAPDATVGKRANVDVLLVVDPVKLHALGLKVFQAPNGVLLCRAVPRAAIIDERPLRKR